MPFSFASSPLSESLEQVMKLKLSKPGSDREGPEVFAWSFLITPQLQGTPETFIIL